MRTALLGYTGFVGGNLAQQYSFSELYNSQNIQEMSGQVYDLIVCAAAPGMKWKANQDPEGDWQSILTLLHVLETVKAKEFVLISTVDVYPVPPTGDETTVIDKNVLHPYGKHRLELEERVQKMFPQTRVIRLPALFGPGLKKNFIFDLIHRRMLDITHPKSRFQFYDVTNLWKDIEKVRQAQISLVNFVTEPVSAGEVAKKSVDIELVPSSETQPIYYDLHTLHSKIFNTEGPYITDAKTVLDGIVKFIQEEGV